MRQRFSIPRSWWWFAVLVSVAIVGAWQYRWIADDGMIDVRVVNNIIHGHGPVFNVGERVEVYTDPLWVAALTLGRVVLFFVPIEWTAVFFGIAFTVIGLYFAYKATLTLAQKRNHEHEIPLGLMALVALPTFWEFSTSGLETGMIMGWLGISWWLTIRGLNRPLGLRAALVIGAGPLIRPDLALFVLPIVVGSLILGSRLHRVTWRRRVLTLLCVALPSVLYEAFRVAYFGLLVSNSAVVKSAFTPWIYQGVRYALDFTNTFWLWVPLGGLGSRDHLGRQYRLA